MMDLPCEHATVDVYSTVGFEKNVTKNIRKYPVDEDGVRQRFEARNWHQDDVELWDPAVPDTIEDLHKDGEDAISLTEMSFPYALEQFSYLFVLFVKFYTSDCTNCEDLAPTWEALGEVITDTSMHIVDEYMEDTDIEGNEYSDDEYEAAVNRVAPVLVTKLNCSVYPSICNGQGVRVYPTMRVFVDGEAKGDYNGHRTVMELVHWLSHIEAEHREPGELKMQTVLKHASERTVRNEEEQEWNDALTSYRAPHNSWNVTRHPGCQLSGHIMVDKAPGKFLIHAQSYGHDIAAHMTNLSHIVQHFSFGDPGAQRHMEEHDLPGMSSRFVKSLHPMDENVYVTGELHQAYHHHLRVIAAEFGEGTMFQWTREKARVVYRILQNSQLSTYRRHIVPEAKWSYEISPIAVSYLEESRTWYDYLTGVLAIVGGAFTVVGMLDSGLSSLSKKKSSYYY
eukprot:CAMPEP_0202031546 /NCGR_PEP_ID=MMETSP0905-20130828/65073_1 /ASSEMBLY_ACC=CAM_ASM_000554 /TAXON_ID=420261 /ORGANISM="Thalassiosira antarctica, Strain CCMP982" /LENGTH=451 /DNA_ID=CAMNT_0048595389 /DNA_START=241 /DNA_END=1596 /DNA_ORIENTATION=-